MLLAAPTRGGAGGTGVGEVADPGGDGGAELGLALELEEALAPGSRAGFPAADVDVPLDRDGAAADGDGTGVEPLMDGTGDVEAAEPVLPRTVGREVGASEATWRPAVLAGVAAASVLLTSAVVPAVSARTSEQVSKLSDPTRAVIGTKRPPG